MERCKFCDSSIDDNVTICPYCKADQTKTLDEMKANNKVKYSYTYKNTDNTTRSANSIAEIYEHANNESNFIGKNISEIAKDIRFIANVIKAFLIIDVIFALFYILGQLGGCS